MATTLSEEVARRRRRKARKKGERSFGGAVALALLATLGAAILLTALLALDPNTGVRQSLDLASGQAQIAPLGPLDMQIKTAVQREQNWFVSPLSYFFGGLALALLVPRAAARAKTLRASVLMALVSNIVLVALLWVPSALSAYSNATVKQSVSVHYFLQQTLWIWVWTLACVAGTWLAQQVRERRTPALEPATA